MIEIKMDHMVFTDKPESILITYGISTCIAFAVRGYTYGTEGCIHFCGLFHWSGFAVDEEEHDKSMFETLYDFFDELRNQLKLDDREMLTLAELSFIGGELAQYDDQGDIIVSGTMREVNALKKAVAEFDYFDEGIDVSSAKITHCHFITSNEQSLTVRCDINSVNQYLDNQHNDSTQIKPNNLDSINPGFF